MPSAAQKKKSGAEILPSQRNTIGIPGINSPIWSIVINISARIFIAVVVTSALLFVFFSVYFTIIVLLCQFFLHKLLVIPAHIPLKIKA